MSNATIISFLVQVIATFIHHLITFPTFYTFVLQTLVLSCVLLRSISSADQTSLIVIMLGRLELSIKQCIVAYMAMMSNIFVKMQHRFSWTTAKFQGRFDTMALGDAIKNVIKAQGIDEDSLLFHPGGKCKV